MAKKKKGLGASLRQQTIPVVQQKAPRTISTNVSTGGGGLASSVKTATQKAEEERSARMRQGLSSVVRSSFNRQMSRPTYINKNTVNRLNQLNKTVTNPLAPIKQKQVTGGNGVGEQKLFSKERSLLNNTKFVTGGQGVGGKTVVNSPIGRAKSSILAPVKEDIQNNYYDAVRKVGMKGSRNERKVYVPLSQRDENGQISTNQRRLENAARGGNRKASVEAALARTKAQTLSGHTYDQIVNAELNKQGLLGQDYLLRSRDPSAEAMDYRQRYGFDQEALDRVLAIANNAPSSGDYNERFNGQQDNGSAIDRLKFGFDESYRARNIEDTLRRQYGVELTPEQQEQLDAVRDSGGYMVGNMLGQASQFAMTAPLSPLVEQGLMARMGLKGGRAAINTTKDAVKYAIARIGADQVVSAPVNMVDALKGENIKDVALRFFYNTGLDILFGGLMEIPSLRTNSKFIKALRTNDAANAMEEGAEQIAAKTAAEKQLSDAISSFNPSEQRAIRERMKQLADDADARREMERGFAGESSADNLGIYNEELPSDLTDYEARRIVDTEKTPTEIARERGEDFRVNSNKVFRDGGVVSQESIVASVRHGIAEANEYDWRVAYDAARRNGLTEEEAIRYADDSLDNILSRANLRNAQPTSRVNEQPSGDALLNAANEAANARRANDTLLNAANNREDRDVLLEAANNRPTRGESEPPSSGGAYGRDVTERYNESIKADEDLDKAIANYDKPLSELSDEETRVWNEAYGQALNDYAGYPDAIERATRAADNAVKQKRNIDLAQAASRAEEAQRAINDLHRTPKEEIDLAQNEIRNANNVSDNVTNNAAEPKTSGADYIPVENKGKVYNADEDVYVTRYDNEGATLTDKPQGLYVAHRSTKSPHTDVGEKQYNLIIDKNARFYDTVFDGKLQTNRMSVPIECGTTVNYLVDKMGKDRVEQLLKTDREYLVKALGEEYPNVDWSRYYDNLEMVEAYGGLVARKDGVDVVRTIDKSATSDFDMTELSVLNDSVIREDADIPTGKREPIAEEPTAPREEPVTRTEPNRKKAKEPKQTQTPNNNGEVDGSTVYNTNGGIDNGAEQKPRSTAKRTVRKVQEQPDSVADAKIGGRRPEERDDLDKLPVFEDSGSGDDVVYGYDKALEYKDDLLKQQENPKASAEKSDKERLFYDAPKPYMPKGGGKDEKAWKAVRAGYEKIKKKEDLLKKKEQIKKAISSGEMRKSEGDERIKLIDNILEQREYYRFGTKKKFDGRDISATADTSRASDFNESVKAKLEDDAAEGIAGNKMGVNPRVAYRRAEERVKADPDAVRIKLEKASPAVREGKLPTGYDNLQDYYADADALTDHYSKRITEMEENGLGDTAECKNMIEESAGVIEGVWSVRSQEGYAAVQYNLMVRSNPEVRVAVIERSLRRIEDEYQAELQKVAKKNGTTIDEEGQIHLTLSKESRKALREVDPDNPLEMAMTLHKISVDTWNQVPANKHEVADAIRKTSMLLNPKTHIRNVFGNVLMIPARIMKDLLGAPLERRAIRKGHMSADQATKAWVNRFSKADKPYYDVAKKVWNEWKDVIRGDAKMFDVMPTSSSRLLGKRPIGEGGVLTAGIENPKAWRRAVDWIIKKNGSALEASDAWMMRIHFTDSFSQVCKARGLDPNKLTKEQLMDVIDAATGEAQRATFRDASEVAKTINKWKTYKEGDTFVQKVGRFSVNTTMPFVNTPINIMRRAWDYSPAGLIHGGGEILQGIQKHNAKQVKKGIDRMCSGVTGSGVCLLGFYLGRSGNLTARLSEGSEGYYEQDQGFQEYSLNIGGEDGWSISLSQFAPHTIPLFMGVELANLFDPNEEVNWKALPDVIGRVFDPSMDMSVMQGPMSILKSIAESDSLGDVPLVAAMTIGTNYISQYIPTLSGQIARTIDPVRRDTSSLQEDKTLKYAEKSWNKTLAKIPFASKTLEPYQDAWGREQVTLEGHPVQRMLYEMVSPSYARKKNVTDIDKEITRLNSLATDDDDKIIPRKFFGNTVSFSGGVVYVDKKDLTTYNKVRGKAAYDAASELIKTDAYKNASDAEKRKMLDKVFKDANTKGKQETLLKKGYSASKVYTDGFEGGKLENAENAFNAGVAPKHYYELMTDPSVDLDGNGSKTQYEVYTYLQNSDLTDAQKAAIWNSYNKSWKNNPYAGGTIPTADGSNSSSGGSKRGRSGRSGGGSGSKKARAKTDSEKRFSNLQKMKAPTTGKGIEALSSGAKGLTKAQKKALIKMMQKKLDV